MCGIFGVVDFARGSLSEGWLPDVADRLRHRGPDDFGTVTLTGDARATLAHRRLRIIDLSPAGIQPMSNEDGSVWVTFNGEIYNYRELRERLLAKGHRFKSMTDTEVLVHLYEEQGPKCVNELNGMFAFGIWDAVNERLVLARDRLGVKPVVYWNHGHRYAFASEIKALLSLPEVERKLDWEGLELFMSFGFVPAPWTCYQEIRKLPPGHLLIADKHGARIEQYWDIEKPDIIEAGPRESFEEELRTLVLDATKIRMHSDVPMGAFLSGGIDSSIVVASMARATSESVRTFSIGYADDRLFDESEYARAVANMYGTRHEEIRLSRREVYEAVPGVLSFFDEPLADSSALPMSILSRETRKRVTVALSGDGGDELFGGYRRYWAEVYRRAAERIPERLRRQLTDHLLAAIPDSKGSQAGELVRRLKIFMKGLGGDAPERHYCWISLFSEDERKSIVAGEAARQFQSVGRAYIASLFPAGLDAINRVLYTDMKSLLPFDMLTKVDWMSMMHSLEVRSPLLDYRVAEMAFRVPGRYKVGPFSLKILLRHAFREMLPNSLWRRKKQGFEVPVGEWLKHDKRFQGLFWDAVRAPEVVSANILNLDRITGLYREHLESRRDHTHRLWALLVLAWWLRGEYGPTI